MGRTAKSGKFDCTTMSLSVLLDYRQEDNKEHSFEVSLFAELFNEMLMRDFGFQIYKCIAGAPVKKEDDKKKDEKKEKDDKKDKEDRKEKEEKKEKEKDKKEKDDRKRDVSMGLPRTYNNNMLLILSLTLNLPLVIKFVK